MNFIQIVTNNPIKSIIGVIAFLIAFVLIASSFYTIKTGHEGIVNRFGKATASSQPGFHFKLPFIDSIEEIEIRLRKNEEKLTASSFEQMITKAKVSVTWTVIKGSAFDLYVKYGGLEQFENRVLDMRIRGISKNVLAKYKAEQIIQDREKVRLHLELDLRNSLNDYPIVLNDIQIENILFPPKYIKSIETKQIEKNLADAEKHKLARQQLKAQQSVNTALAKRDSDKAIADGRSYAIEKEADAEAKAILAKGKANAEIIKLEAAALKGNPDLIKLRQVQSWNGRMPKMMFGNSPNILLDVDGK